MIVVKLLVDNSDIYHILYMIIYIYSCYTYYYDYHILMGIKMQPVCDDIIGMYIYIDILMCIYTYIYIDI